MQIENPIEKYTQIVVVEDKEIKEENDSPIRWIRT
jgi:hypothetical protein